MEIIGTGLHGRAANQRQSENLPKFQGESNVQEGLDAALKIAHVGKYYPPHMGGIEVHLRDLVIRQAQCCDVKVLVANDGIRTIRERRDGAELTRAGCLGTLWSMPACPTLPWHLRCTRADLIHMHMPNPAAAFAYIISGCRIPLVITHHSDTMGRAQIRRLSDPFVQEAMRRAARIIVTSRRYGDSSIELKEDREKIDVVPYGIDPANFESADPGRIETIRARYGPNLVIGVGRLAWFKGFEILIQAMRNVPGNLVLIGDGPLRRDLEEMAAKCEVSQRVYFLGNVDNSQIVDYLCAADVFAMPSISRAESFGIVQLEAMAAGIPVVNTSIDSGTPDISPHGVTGLTVPPGEPIALAQALTFLLSDRERRRAMGESGRARVRKEFSIEQMFEKTMRIYEGVIRTHAKARYGSRLSG